MHVRPALLRVGVGGFGTIGGAVARHLDDGIAGLELAAISARNRGRAAQKLSGFRKRVPVVSLGELPEHADVVVECTPASAFAEVAGPAVQVGRSLIVMSCGQLIERPDLVETARNTGARIIVPSGALLGLDAMRAAAEGVIYSVRMVTMKPPKSLAGVPYLETHGIRLDGLEEPLKIFEGTAREGVRGFPANVNVAAALSLAGIGPDQTRLEIWADPRLTRNTHHVIVDSDSARFEMRIENVPSEENPGTGRITALSVVATLRALTAPLRVGS
jgi:aspartate dehydrogenase